MVINALPSENETTAVNDKIQSKAKNGNTTVQQKAVNASLSPSSNRILVLACLIYFVYSVSIAVDSQFLSLYYKSKGFDATTLGLLYSLTPLTTFLTVPIWGTLTRKNGKSKSSVNGEATKRPFQILCMNIVIATVSQISLAILDKPIYMMMAITVTGVFQSPNKPMLDGIIMDYMDDRSDFGKVRFFGILGSGFGTNLGGRLLTMATKLTANNHNEDVGILWFWDFMLKLLPGFNLLFFARFILTVPTIIGIRQLTIASTRKIKNGENSLSNHALEPTKKNLNDHGEETPTPIVSVARDVAKYCFRDRNHALFFLRIFIAGASGGVSDAFSYPRYQESGCSTTHMGQSRLISSCAAAITFWFSGRLTRRLGIQNVLFLNMIFAGIRFSLLNRMDHFYFVYPIDFIRAISYGAFWSSSTLYASEIGPPHLRGSILLLLNGIYNGIGRSTGAIVGGKFQAIFGTNNLFFYSAWINYASALVMGAFYYRISKSDSTNVNSFIKAKKEI